MTATTRVAAIELLLADCYVRRDRVALIAFRGKTVVGSKLISVNRCASSDVLFDDGLERLGFTVRDNLCHHLPIAFHRPQTTLQSDQHFFFCDS
jgi:hypothetical protein